MAGLATTIVVMNVFDAAQPALLYIVPAVLGAVALHAMLRGETSKVGVRMHRKVTFMLIGCVYWEAELCARYSCWSTARRARRRRRRRRRGTREFWTMSMSSSG